MDLREIESLNKRVDTINRAIVEKRTQIKMLKEQFTKKMDELESLGVTGLKAAKEDFLKVVEDRIRKSDEECEALAAKIEKAVIHAEQQLNTDDETF